MNLRDKFTYYPKYLLVLSAFIKYALGGSSNKAMQSRTKSHQSREKIGEMVKRAFPKTALAEGDDAVIEFTEGWFNAVYKVGLADGREVVLKIAPPPSAEIMSYERNIMATEVAAMRLAKQNPSIPVPEIYAYDTTLQVCGSEYYFMEKAAGSNYELTKKSLPKETRTAIDQQIGAIVKELNKFTGTYFGYEGNPALRAPTWKEAFLKICDAVLEDGQKKSADYVFSVEEIRSVIQKHAHTLEAVTLPQLVHWDLWDLNVFVKEGKVSGVIDFERALWADPLMEAQFRALAYGGITDSLHGYGKTAFTPDEDIRNHLYSLHLGLVMATECQYRNYDTDKVANLAKVFLIPAMIWLLEH
jgi:aminoglycoside phosphotransferase (APT) family kinase protein